MSETINLNDAKTNLSQLVRRASEGEEIVIARFGKPMARLVPLATQEKRPFGYARHLDIPDDLFLEPTDPEEVAAANGEYTDHDFLPLKRSGE